MVKLGWWEGMLAARIYAKIDASSRAAAAMFAVQHGLLPEEKLASAPRAAQGG